MHFKNKNTEFFIILFFGAVSFVAGMNLEDMLNLPEYAIMLIGIGLYILAYGIYRLRIRLNPLRRIERKIHKLPYKHQQIEMFFDEYIPETRKTFPKTIYKYVYLSDASEAERIALRSLSDQVEVDKWILNSSHRTSNENKLYSLATNSLWFSRSNNPDLNDPFEGRRIIYDDDFIPLPKDEIEYWKQYAEAVRNKLFLCCFSKDSDSPPMWAHYANNHKGFCVEYELLEINKQLQFTPIPIIYSNEKVFVGSLFPQSLEKSVTKMIVDGLSTKSTEWSYEKEWRIIRDDSACGDKWNSEKLGALLPMIRPTSIILGCESTSSFQTIVEQYCRENKINLYKMEKDNHLYKLNKKVLLSFDTQDI